MESANASESIAFISSVFNVWEPVCIARAFIHSTTRLRSENSNCKAYQLPTPGRLCSHVHDVRNQNVWYTRCTQSSDDPHALHGIGFGFWHQPLAESSTLDGKRAVAVCLLPCYRHPNTSAVGFGWSTLCVPLPVRLTPPWMRARVFFFIFFCDYCQTEDLL